MYMYGTPVKVLAVFEPDKAPRPYKMKYEDQPIVVDKIISIDDAYSFIAFECISFNEVGSDRFELIYVKEACQWQVKIK